MDVLDTPTVSRYLSRYLDCHPGVGFQENVCVKRFMKDLIGEMFASSISKIILTGSKAEGLVLKGSDDDFMIILRDLIVVQENDAISERDVVNKPILAMDNTGCWPGYTLLRLLHIGSVPDRKFFDAMKDINGSKYLSSSEFMSQMVSKGYHLHGPCAATALRGMMDVDSATCFHCSTWPNESDFNNRTKYCVWPPRHLVNHIIRRGCHVAAIGDKGSDMFAMQWRISFALAEKTLVASFSHLQLKTYALLKIFLKECIERDSSVRELLSSYFMKTIVFHAIEHSRPSMWVDENIIQCFWYCFTLLLECVQTGYLPNYFILTNNMFRSKVTGDNRIRLLRVLSRYHNMGYTCLFECPTFHSLLPIIQESGSIFPSSLDGELQEFYQDIEVLRSIPETNSANVNHAKAFKLIDSIVLKDSDNLIDIALLFYINVFTNISNKSIADMTRSHCLCNKTAYRRIRRHKQVLHVSSATTVNHGLLSLGTYFYNVGCYNKASEVATRVVLACQKSGLLQECSWNNEYFLEMCGKGYTLLEKSKRSFVYPFMIHKYNHQLYLLELFYEVQTNEQTIYLFSYRTLSFSLFCPHLDSVTLTSPKQSSMISWLYGPILHMEWITIPSYTTWSGYVINCWVTHDRLSKRFWSHTANVLTKRLYLGL